ncbi:MAG: hypothetical protein R3A48_20165 [Polyangiales bacterium]
MVVEPMHRSRLEASAGLRRFDASIDLAHGGAAGADDGVDLVDEQHGVGDLLERAEHGLQPLELLLETGAREQRAHAEE